MWSICFIIIFKRRSGTDEVIELRVMEMNIVDVSRSKIFFNAIDKAHGELF